MKLDTVSMDRAQAYQAYMQYRAAQRREGLSPEDAMLKRGYRQIALGRRLIDLTHVMRTAGVGNDGYPRLAIARADALHVRVEVTREGEAFGTVRFRCGRYRKDERWSFAAGTFTGRLPEHVMRTVGTGTDAWRPMWANAHAIVPSIPVALRPVADRANYAILWEVEAGGWAEENARPLAPHDPALLKHIGGDLYAVLAVWDLTPLERAVIAGTRRS